jgi:hypothetical protein
MASGIMTYEPNHKDPDDQFDDSEVLIGRTQGSAEDEEERSYFDDEDMFDDEDLADEGDLDFEPDDSRY